MSLAVHPGGLVVTLVWLPPQRSSPHPAYTRYYSHGTHQYPIYSVWMSSALFPVQWGDKWWRRHYKSKHVRLYDPRCYPLSFCSHELDTGTYSLNQNLHINECFWAGEGVLNIFIFGCIKKQDPPQGYQIIFRKRAAAPFLPMSENNTLMTNTTKWWNIVTLLFFWIKISEINSLWKATECVYQ